MKNKEIINQFETLDSLGENASRQEKQARGTAFEDLMIHYFKNNNILLRESYFTDASQDNRSEQIDGAILIKTRVALLEIKWVESNLAASELYSFIGKIDCKMPGTIGVFISREKLSNNVIKAIRNGRKPSVLIIHGEDVKSILCEPINILDYLDKYVLAMSIDNISIYTIKDYQRDINIARWQTSSYQPPNDPKPPGSDDNENTKKTNTTKVLTAESTIKELYNNPDYVSLFKISNHNKQSASKLLKELALIYEDAYKLLKSKGREDDLSTVVKTLKKTADLKSIKAVYKIAENDLLSQSTHNLLSAMSDTYKTLDPSIASSFESKLVQAWQKAIGDFDEEDKLTTITQPLFEDFSKNTKIELVDFLAEIYGSTNRSEKYPKKKFAKEIMENKDHTDIIEQSMQNNLDKLIKRVQKSTSSVEEKRNEVLWLLDFMKSTKGYKKVFPSSKYETLLGNALKDA